VALALVQIEVGMMLNFNTIFGAPNGDCAVVDPAYEVDRVLKAIAERGWRVTTILVTHTHHDHVDGVEEMAARTGAETRVGAGELTGLRRFAPQAPVRPIADGEVVHVGGEALRAITTPGHTVDARSYYHDEPGARAVATGDTLFVGGVGRTDLPGGHAPTLWHSLQRLAALPEETRIYPGHDYGQTPTSTIGWERTANPYLLCADVDAFVALRTGKSPHRPTRGPR
jgi:glyoxylase-like metal-dependent hydrolase (beta-lactamase superfamily II)